MGLINRIIAMLSTNIVQADLADSYITAVKRGTPQEGVISPLFWLLVINKILFKLDREGIKIVDFVDDVVILVLGLFPTVISEIMENALQRVGTWATGSGLDVNTDNTELIFFTTKTKILDFNLPKLNGKAIQLSSSAKYLGVISDSKLSWKLNVKKE